MSKHRTGWRIVIDNIYNYDSLYGALTCNWVSGLLFYTDVMYPKVLAIKRPDIY